MASSREQDKKAGRRLDTAQAIADVSPVGRNTMEYLLKSELEQISTII